MRTTLRRVLSVVAVSTFGIAVVGADAPTTYQTVNMIHLPPANPPVPAGSAATLYRTQQSLEMRVAASGLDANSGFSVWWVVFDNPAGCLNGCGGDDVNAGRGDVSVFYAAGFVTGQDGTANVDAHIDAGALPAGIDIETGDGLDPGNGFDAEVHIVVRSHGPITPGQVHKQIGTFNEGCQPPTPPGTPTSCRNVQAAIFPPV